MLNKLERKIGRYAIRNLMFYVIILYVAGYVLSIVSPDFYYNWLMLDVDKVLKGQVWRLVTFLIQPIESSNVLFMMISLYLYYIIGKSLEQRWGAFRFNVFYFGGVLCNILYVFIMYAALAVIFNSPYSFPVTLEFLNLSMFLAFAVEYSDVQLLLFFVIPVKMKWLGIVYGGIEAYSIISMLVKAFRTGDSFYERYAVATAIAVVVALLNFLVFFFTSIRKNRKRNAGNARRARVYREGVERGYTYGNVASNPATGRAVITRHKCAICGRTELDGEDLEFRFCSKCNGNYEYCMDHLFTHTHVGADDSDKGSTFGGY